MNLKQNTFQELICSVLGQNDLSLLDLQHPVTSSFS